VVSLGGIMKTKNNVQEFYQKCIIYSVAHALMSFEFPMTSETNAWDGNVMLLNDMEGNRGVVSFEEDICTMAFLNYQSFKGPLDYSALTSDSKKINLAFENVTTEYMYESVRGKKLKCVSTIGWFSSSETLVLSHSLEEFIELGGGVVYEILFCSIDELLASIIENNEMSESQYNIFIDVAEKKINSANEKIELSRNQINVFLKNCEDESSGLERLEELNIYVLK
jgi:hypothetical protein